MLTELTAFQHTAPDRDERVVLALRQIAVSLSICSCVGVPETHGCSSAGLHIPGAAHLAKIAS